MSTEQNKAVSQPIQSAELAAGKAWDQYVLRELLTSLPAKRDWLSPDVEAALRVMLVTASLPTQPVQSDLNALTLAEDDVEWVVNDIAELGVKIGNQFFFLYKGDSLQYKEGTHDDGRPMMWRPVFKREFGECAHPINHKDYSKIGTVSLSDSDEWKALPAAAPALPAATPEPSLTDAVIKRIANENLMYTHGYENDPADYCKRFARAIERHLSAAPTKKG